MLNAPWGTGKSHYIQNVLRDYLKKGISFQNSLAYYEEQIYLLEDLQEEIRRQIRNGEVDDYASKELSQIRIQITKCEEKIINLEYDLNKIGIVNIVHYPFSYVFYLCNSYQNTIFYIPEYSIVLYCTCITPVKNTISYIVPCSTSIFKWYHI